MSLSKRLAGAFCAFSALALGLLPAAAAEEGQDHPAVARYPGAVIKSYDVKEFEEAQLVLARPSGDPPVPADKLLPLEGRITFIHYEVPATASTLQIFRNHQSALRRSGFKELFVCDRPCGDLHFSSWKPLLKAERAYLNGGARDLFYVAAQRENLYVSLAVNDVGGTPSVFLFVIEKGALDDQRIPVAGNSPIAVALAGQGRVDLYGFQFDTGRTELRPESAATLAELGRVLADNPKLAIDIVGHTDDVGNAEANQALSLGRAQAVAAALTAQQGIAPARLRASGRGQTAPVASNKSESGRARNRRVEVVARSAEPAPAPTAAAQAPAPEAAAPPPAKADKASKALDAAKKLRDLLGR